MHEGGKRRATIPARLAYLNDQTLEPQPPEYSSKRQILVHRKESWLIELRVLKILKKGTVV